MSEYSKSSSSRDISKKRRALSQEVPSGTMVPSNRDSSALWTFNRGRVGDPPNEGLFPGDESIEIEPASDISNEASEDTEDEAEEEVDSILLQQSDLTERILAAEKRFSTSSSSLRNFLRYSSAGPSFLKNSKKVFKSTNASLTDSIKDESDVDDSIIKSSAHAYPYDDYFSDPILYRVLFMGSICRKKKEDLLKKLTQGLIYVLHNTKQKHVFVETKYNIAFLNDPLDPIITQQQSELIPIISSPSPPQQKESFFFKDLGVSLIEADFTWSSFKTDSMNGEIEEEERALSELRYLLLQYAWHQCPHPTDLPATSYLKELLADEPTPTTLTVRPEKTPNGIDLVIYIYDGQLPITETENGDKRVRKELEVLCILRKFGIYVLPLTVYRDEKIKKHFADLLTQYKVRCLDLSNLDVGQTPSFKRTSLDAAAATAAPSNKEHTSNRRRSQDELELSQLDRLSKLQKMECLQFNEPRVATYQILTVDQFCAINDGAIFELLKRTRERHVFLKEEEYRSKLQQKEQQKGKERVNGDGRLGESSIRKRKYMSKVVEKDTTSNHVSESTKEHHAQLLATRSQAHIKFKHGWYVDCYQFAKAMAFLLCCGYFIYRAINSFKASYQWTAQFEMIQFPCERDGLKIHDYTLCNDTNPPFHFAVTTRNPKGELDWASIAPQVFLLDDQRKQQEQSIPIQKIHDRPGYYLMDFTPFLRPITSRLSSYTFTVNKHHRFGHIHYTSIPSDPTVFKIYIDDTMAKKKNQSKNKQQQVTEEESTISSMHETQDQEHTNEQEQTTSIVSVQDVIDSMIFYKNNFIKTIKSAIFIRN